MGVLFISEFKKMRYVVDESDLCEVTLQINGDWQMGFCFFPLRGQIITFP